MATYKKVCTGAAYDTYTLRLVLEETSKSDINNNSKINYWLYLDTSYPRFEDYTCTYKFSITGIGDIFSESKKRSMPATRGESLLLKSGTTNAIAHDSAGNKTISFTASFACASGAYTAGSATITSTFTMSKLDRVAPTVTQADISAITSNSFKISASANYDCDIWQYTLNGGTTWTDFSTTKGKSASKTLTGLTAGKTYTCSIRARKENNHLYGQSGAKSAMTLGASVIGTIPAFNVEDGFKVPLTKYVAGATDSLVVKLNGTVVGTVSNYENNELKTFENQHILDIYNLIPENQKRATFTFELTTTYNGTVIGTSSGNATGTLAGTAKVKVEGEFKRGVVWQKISGVWKRGIIFVNANGDWKRGE